MAREMDRAAFLRSAENVCPRTLVYISLEREREKGVAFAAIANPLWLLHKTPLAVSRGRVVQTIMPMPIERGNIDISHQIKIARYRPQEKMFCMRLLALVSALEIA
jgi:hypothetical protein